MKAIELVVPLPWGRPLKIRLYLKEIEMAKKKIKVRIVNPHGLAYWPGREYDLDEDLAKKLIDEGKAVPVVEKKKERATRKTDNVEKR